MRPLLRSVALALGLAGFPAVTFAHHGWNWAEEAVVEMTGTIRGVSMDPPHPVLMVEDANGALWTVELGNPGQTQRSGFMAESAREGDSVTILGNRSREAEERRMKAVRVTIGDAVYDIYPDRLPEGVAPAR